MWRSGFLAHTFVQWHISKNHKVMLTNSLTSMTNVVEHETAMMYFSTLSCVFMYLFESGVLGCV